MAGRIHAQMRQGGGWSAAGRIRQYCDISGPRMGGWRSSWPKRHSREWCSHTKRVDIIAERSTITQSVQIGVELTPGTAVAANKRLGSMGFAIGTETEISPLRPIGQKYPSLQILGKEWSEADLEGSPVYTELPYAFASLMNAPQVSQIMDGPTPTGAYLWTFESNTYGDDNPVTFTVEQGSSFRAHRVSNCILKEYTMEWSREEIELSGTWLARAIEDGITLTPGPTALQQIPVKPSDLSVYLDTTPTNIGKTKMLRALKGEFNIEDRFEPLWVVDREQSSFAAVIEGEPTVEFKMTMMADAQAMASLNSMRNGTTSFLRLEGVGPIIYTPTDGDPIRHRMVIDLAGQVSEVAPFDDEDGVYAIEWTFATVHDPEWGRAYRAMVTTTTASL